MLQLGLRSKIILTYLVSFLVLFAIVSFFFFSNLNQVLMKETKQGLRDNAHFVKESILARYPTADRDFRQSVDSFVDGLAKQSSYRISVIDGKGALIADSTLSDPDLELAENHENRPEILQMRAKGEGWGKRISATTGRKHLYYAVPLKIANGENSSVRLAVWMESYQALWRNIIIGSIFVFAGALLTMVLISILLSRWVLQPIREMARVASQFSKQNFKEKLHIKSADEIGDLSITLNQMAGELELKLKELAEDKGQLETVLANMAEGVLMTTRSREILMMNPSFKLFFQTSMPIDHETVLAHLRSIELDDFLKETVEKGKAIKKEMTLDQSPALTLEINASPIIVNEKTIGIVAVFHNVTEMRQIERERRDFFQNVSHELKTPLTSIKGYIEMILDEKGISKDIRENLRVIKNNSDRLEELVYDAMELSQFDIQPKKIDRQNIDPQVAVSNLINDFKSELQQRRLKIVNAVPQGFLLNIAETHFNQIILNLISNAVKYSKPDSEIVVRCEKSESGDRLCFQIQDHGIGISKEDTNRIFERFYRVNKDRNRATGGTGLGLSIVKSVIEFYGGQINVESQLAHGSTFSFDLPC